MADEEYLAAKIRAWAYFPDLGLTFEDVISVSATFALNTIPTASVVVAVGRSFNDGVQDATIHKNKEKLKPREKAEVFVEISNLVGRQIGITPGKYKIFEGYVAGLGYQRSHNHANYVINLVHWLDDMNNSSAINGNWFPGVPHDWAQQALYDQIGPGGTLSAFTPTPSVSAEFASPDNLKSDIWEATIKPLLLAIAGFPSGKVQERDMPAGGADIKNDAAQKALERMPGKAPKYSPLGLEIGGGAGACSNLPRSVSAYFSQSIGTSFAQNSMWAKLLDYASQFFFAISPSVEWATPIPFCAGLRAVEGQAKKITAKEYNYANFNANMSMLLEAVYIHYPLASATNLPNGPPASQNLSFYYPWASFPDPKSGDPQPRAGLKLFKNAPGWLSNLDPGYLITASAVQYRRDGLDVRGLVGGGGGCFENVKDAHTNQKSLVKKLAEHWYYTEILQQRYGELAGPLRFDIAPGSILKIETPPRDRDLDDNNPFVCASVISVSYVVNSERATAGTSFTIAHQKTSAENQDPLYSVAKPPLYKQPWFLGPLAEVDAGFVGDINPGAGAGQV
jgi:hypothetical protein